MGVRSVTWKHIRRSPYQATTAVLTVFLTFLLGGFYFLATIASVFTLNYFEGKPQITVFFSDTAGQAEADKLKADLEHTGKVSSITYVSKEEALALYREQNKKDPLLLEMVTADILPASLEISARDPKFLSELEPVIKQAQGVEDTIYQKDVVDSLIAWTNAIRTIGGVLAGLLAVDAVLIIITVIGMKIALRKDEIEILKLVGASPWYIRMPFVLEGIVYGAAGAVGAWAVLTTLMVIFRDYILQFLGVIPAISTIMTNPAGLPFISGSGIFLGLMIVSGTILGLIGSIASVGRYLRFQ
ncbi:hypothetical protein A2Z33_02780 [Candidatus Gottesmanbacteria bacterium RBG_16_52_11]|uniref:Cell division protein FtsX n=1 Tax=Candidatus Gottesmanbacteria bacterium RBG_16_52_11 TaxID=1798374 RepID=A0A1F5YMQ8_9BACT|nr:MAG: hypothetical protein A2Z33_02780 [Candidatus Gottesmanbacteria bacterium RBG_16_52_11]